MNDRCVGVVFKDNKVLTFWRYRKGREYYILPGGTLEEGEQQEETLIREMMEETNLEVKIEKRLLDYYNNYEHPRTDHYFLITEFNGEIKLGSPELTHQHKENIFRPEWIDLDKLKEINLMPEEVKLQLIDLLKQYQ